MGVCPYFHIGALAIPAYGAFLLLALGVGVVTAYHSARRQGYASEQTLLLVFAAFFGGVLGAKIPVWVMYGADILRSHSLLALFSGRTVIGGLIGGTLAVLLTRRSLGLTASSGNVFAPALALAIAVGRWGCFCGGCCYGKLTSLPIGVRLGDSLLHYPTQLLESAFAVGLFLYLLSAERRGPAPGALFRAFMLAYFTFRFFIEFLRTDTPILLGLTLAQVASVGVVAYYLLNKPRKQEPAHDG